MRRSIGNNALSLVFLGLFLLAATAEAVAGYAEYNQQQLASGLDEISYGRYLTSSHYLVALMENWQSEFLQFFLFIWLTVWLVQKGSAESKEPGQEGRGTDEEQLVGKHAPPDGPALARRKGFAHKLYEHSLLVVFGFLFVLTWSAQALTGWVAFNEDQLRDYQQTETFWSYLVGADFWSRTAENWQSEFLAVGTMAVFSIWLRERGSPESKKVGSPHAKTGSDV